MISCAHIAEMEASAVYIVGAQEPGYARGMGMKTRATFEEALKDAENMWVRRRESSPYPRPSLAGVHLMMEDDVI